MVSKSITDAVIKYKDGCHTFQRLPKCGPVEYNERQNKRQEQKLSSVGLRIFRYRVTPQLNVKVSLITTTC